VLSNPRFTTITNNVFIFHTAWASSAGFPRTCASTFHANAQKDTCSFPKNLFGKILSSFINLPNLPKYRSTEIAQSAQRPLEHVSIPEAVFPQVYRPALLQPLVSFNVSVPMCHNDLVLGSRSQKRSKQSRLEAKETRQTAPFKRRESRSLLAPLRRTAPVRPSPLSYHGSQRVSLKVLIQPGYTLITRDLGYLTIKKAISRRSTSCSSGRMLDQFSTRDSDFLPVLAFCRLVSGVSARGCSVVIGGFHQKKQQQKPRRRA
jgi:hypothetical protein